jgi:hypothetical protein
MDPAGNVTAFGQQPASWIELLHDDEAFSAATGTSPWICATACAAMVGLSGLFPMLLISGSTRNDARLRYEG